MSASQEPVDPKQEGQQPDTSEQLEVNEAQTVGDVAGQQGEGLVQFGAAEGENLEAMLKSAQEEIARYHDELLRARAEIENVRRRAQDDVAKARKFGTEAFAESLIPVRGSFEAPLALSDQSAESWKEGVEATLRH